MRTNGVSVEALREWLKILEDAIDRMRVDQHIFRAVFKIIEENPALNSHPSHLYAWMYDNYLERMAMGVRRLRDQRHDTISLTRFLRRIKGDPTVISREFYASHFPAIFPHIPRATKEEKAVLRRRIVDEEYDRMVGPGLHQPSAEILEMQIQWLNTLGTPVVDYATKRIAHHDELPPTDYPTLDDVDTFIEFAEELLKIYIVLLTAVSRDFSVNFQYDWLAPLRVTWLPDNAWLAGRFNQSGEN
jgi:hypothetical protein